MCGSGRGEIVIESHQADGRAGCRGAGWKTAGRIKRKLSRVVGWESKNVIGRTGGSVQDIRSAQVAEVRNHGQVQAAIQSNGFLGTTVAQSEAAANDQSIAEVMTEYATGTPGKSDLRSPIVVAGFVRVDVGPDGESGKAIGAASEIHHAQVAEFF